MKRFILDLDIPTQTFENVAWVLDEVAAELREVGLLYKPVDGMTQGIDGKTGKVGSWRITEVEDGQ